MTQAGHFAREFRWAQNDKRGQNIICAGTSAPSLFRAFPTTPAQLLPFGLLATEVIATAQTKPDPATTRGEPFVVSEQPEDVQLCCSRLDPHIQFDRTTPVARSSPEDFGDEPYAALTVPGARHVAPDAPPTRGLEATANF
jgi:hypothetical protein